MAVSVVFGIPELLEQILLHLPIRDLLMAQGISTCFQATIMSSPKIQQVLFFRPAPYKDSTSWTLNPLLPESFIPWFRTSNGRQWNDLSSCKSVEALHWNLYDSIGYRLPFLYPTASWRRMLVVQPPPDTLHVVQFAVAPLGHRYSRKRSTLSFADHGPKQVTMGAIYDLTISFLSENTVGRFRLSIAEMESSPPQFTLYLLMDTGRQHPNARINREWGQKFCSGAEFIWELDRVVFEDWSYATNRFSFTSLVESSTSKWRTDLTSQRLGVTDDEFEKFLRKHEERTPKPPFIPESSYYLGRMI